jgi:hypothetical protein
MTKLEMLLKSVFAKDVTTGQFSIRVVKQTKATGELENAVKSHSTRNIATLTELCIVMDVDGNPALLISEVT